MNGGENVAKQIEGVYDKLIECAKVEFLEKGFKDASLRTIAKNAHTRPDLISNTHKSFAFMRLITISS